MENEYEPINLGDMKEVRDEEVMFVESGYLKLPSNFKLRHDIRTGPKAFKANFPNPEATHMEDDSGFEYLVYRWKKADLDAYDEKCKELVEEATDTDPTPESRLITTDGSELHTIDTKTPHTALQGINENDISRIPLSESEDTKKNRAQLQMMEHNRRLREEKAGASMLPDDGARDIYFLNIVDRDFARQVPIDPEHLKDQVMKYRVMDEADLGGVLERLQENGTASLMGDGRWFFKNTMDIPVQEDEQGPEADTDTPEDTDPSEQESADDSPIKEEETEELEEIEEEPVDEEKEETEQTKINWGA